MNVSGIDTLYAYEDGDVITPGMGVSIASGHALAQFFNPSTGLISSDSDFTVAANQPTIYPLPYSSKQGTYVIPNIEGQQWYYQNLQNENSAILDSSGNVKSTYSKLFQKTTYTLNGKSYPALKIIGNLCSSTDQVNKTLYYVSTVGSTQVVCKIDIPINVSIGTPYNVVISCVNSDGDNDTVMDVDGEYLKLTQQLNTGNTEVSATGYKWQKLVGGAWTDISTTSGVYAVSSNGKVLQVFDAGVNGVENFRAVCTLDGKTYYAVIPLSDTRDPFFVDMGRNTPNNYIRSNETVTYTPVVYSRSTQEKQNGWSFEFTLTDEDQDTISTKTASSISISGTDIKEHGCIHVHIKATHAD